MSKGLLQDQGSLVAGDGDGNWGGGWEEVAEVWVGGASLVTTPAVAPAVRPSRQ